MRRPRIPAETHRRRRERLARKLGDGTALVCAKPAPGDHAEIYRPDPDLLYLTGMAEPHSALSITVRDGKIEEETIFCRERDVDRERWDGEILGPTRARNWLGIGDAAKWEGIGAFAREQVPQEGDVFVKFEKGNQLPNRCAQAMASSAGPSSRAMRDLRGAMATLRMVKDGEEIASIKMSCSLAVKAMERVRTGMAAASSEAGLEAIISHEYASAGANHAFRPIVACGKNACVAHYVENSSRLAKGRLVLVDTGASLDGYASDITRVYPVTGDFSPAQKELYEVVLRAQKAAMSNVRPGGTMARAQRAACRALARGLADMGICRGPVARVLSSGDFADFYFHSIGHMLGLEVHDAYLRTGPDGKPTKLRSNMVVTIEPGLYLDDRKCVPKELRFTGIRIEDTVLVTRTGNEALTAGTPKAASALGA